MLLLKELTQLSQVLSSTSYCFLIKAVKQQKLTSLQYNAILTEVTEAYSKAGMSMPAEMLHPSFVSTPPILSENFWALLKVVATSGIIVAFPTTGLQPEELKRRYDEAVTTMETNAVAAGRTPPSLPAFPPLTDFKG